MQSARSLIKPFEVNRVALFNCFERLEPTRAMSREDNVSWLAHVSAAE